VKVKICGITNLEDAMQAISFGADAVGFQVGMRHKTEDEVSPEEAKSIVASLPPFVSYVMVTLDTENSCHSLRRVFLPTPYYYGSIWHPYIKKFVVWFPR
jgi:phosphoribosylanthranilate isomerase